MRYQWVPWFIIIIILLFDIPSNFKNGAGKIKFLILSPSYPMLAFYYICFIHIIISLHAYLLNHLRVRCWPKYLSVSCLHARGEVTSVQFCHQPQVGCPRHILQQKRAEGHTLRLHVMSLQCPLICLCLSLTSYDIPFLTILLWSNFEIRKIETVQNFHIPFALKLTSCVTIMKPGNQCWWNTVTHPLTLLNGGPVPPVLPCSRARSARPSVGASPSGPPVLVPP